MVRMSLGAYNGIIKLKSKTNKYGNKKTEYKGRTYDSAKEAEYARALDQMKSAVDPRDRVIEYIPQAKYRLEVENVLICNYYLDFYVRYADGHVEYIDVKPLDSKTGKFRTTAEYKLKKKLMRALHNIEIKEV